MIGLLKKLLGFNKKNLKNSPKFDLPINLYNLIPTRELILTAKSQGIEFGTGNPLERIRYLIKLGLLPYAVRKTITDVISNKSRVEGHLPVWTIERLRQIQNLNKQGVTVLEIKQKVDQNLLQLFDPNVILVSKAHPESDTGPASMTENNHHPPGLSTFKSLNLSRLLTPGAYLFIGGIALTLGLTIAYKIDPDQTKVLGQKIASTKILSPINNMASIIAGVQTPEDSIVLSSLPTKNTSGISQGLVLAESSPSGSFLEINLDTRINGSLQASIASIAGTLSSASINTGFGDNEVYPMDQAVRSSDDVEFADLTLKGNGNIGGTLDVTDNSTLNGTLTVTGASTLKGAATLSSTLAVSGATTLSDTLKVSGASTLTGAVTASSTLAVTGAVTAASTVTVTGATVLSSTLAVSGTSTLTGAVTASSTLAVSGASTLTGAVTASSTLDVTGATTLSSYLGLAQISAPSTTTNRLYNVSGDLTWNGVNVTAGGAIPVGTNGQTMYNSAGTWTATTNLYHNGTNVGIGTSLPASKLGVNGNVGIGVSYSNASTPINGLAVAGNVGIGTTTANNALSVNGAINVGTTLGITAPTNGALITGNVGIGGTSANYKLDVWGSQRITGALNVDSTTTFANSLIGYQGVTAPTSGLAIQGNLGLGTTTPNSKLSVIGGGTFGADFGGFSAPTNGLLIQGNVGIGATSANYSLDVWGTTRITGNSQLDGTLSVRSTSSLLGNVGIGTTTANSTLSVAGSAHIGSLRQGIAAPTDGLFVDGNVGIGATTSTNKLDVWGSQRIAGNLTVDTTGTFGNGLFGYKDVTGPTNGLAVSGNVGIGTTTAIAPLHVSGNITTSALFSNGNVGIGFTTPTASLHIVNTTSQDSFRVDDQANDLSHFVINLDGNVGIANSAPSFALDIIGSQRISQNLNLDGTTGITSSGAGAGITFSGSGNHDISASSGTLRTSAFTSTGSITLATNMDLLAAGSGSDVGTSGTRFSTGWFDTIDATNLAGTVTGGSTSSSSWTINSDNSTDDAESASLAFERGNLSPNAVLGWDHTTKQFTLNSGINLTGTILSTWGINFGSTTFDITSNNNEDINIVPGGTTGNVGIGTTSPLGKLYIRGNGSTTGITLQTVGSDLTQGLTVLDNGNLGVGITLPSQKFQVNSGSSSTVITSTGNIGIGTTTANNALSVNGAINVGTTLGITAPTNGALITGNVGIGGTSAEYKLDVWGTARVTGALTTTGGIVSGSTLSIVDGTASTPGLNFANDTDSGLWRIGTNQIALTTAGGAHSGLSINSSGNIGIGNTNATNKLDVFGSAAFGTFSGSVAPTNGLAVSGNVGIGTTSPLTALQVQGGGTYSAFFLNGNVGIGFTSPDRLLQLAFDANPAGTNASLINTAATTQLSLTGSSAGGLQKKLVLGIDTTDNYGVIQAGHTDGTNYNLSLNPAGGNVGIGTTNPLGIFHVAFNDTNTVHNNVTFPRIQNTSTTANSFVGLTFDGMRGGARYPAGTITYDYAGEGDSYQTNLHIRNILNGSYNEVMTILNTGNVGIGFTSPDRLTQLASDINIVGTNASLLGAAGTQFALTGSSATGSQKKLVLGIDTTDNYGVIQAGNTDGTNYNLSLNPAGGNIGIGTTTSVNALSINGAINIGTTLGITAPTNGALITGNVGIGGTSAAYNLDVWGTARVTGALTAAAGATLGSTLSIVDGSSSTPGLNFANDTDSGLWRKGANFLALTTNGAGSLQSGQSINGLSINATGNVGIGTTNPGTQLEVAGALQLSSTLSNGYSRWQLYLTTSTVDATQSDLRFFGGSAGETMILTQAGNVGIGFTSPDRRTQIASDANPAGTNASLIGTAGTTQLSLTGSSASGLSKKLVLGIDTTDNYGVIQAGHTDGTNYNLSLNPAGGNVGIGTTGPTAPLAVTTTVNGVGIYATSATDNTALTLNNSGTGGKEWRVYSTGGGSGFGQGNLTFQDQADSIPTLTLTGNGTSAGNVGIGTTNPVAKLHTYSTTDAANRTQSTGTSTNYANFEAYNNNNSVAALVSYGSGYTTNLFGTPRNDFSALLSDGASSNGMMIGTISADPIIIGTNNAENIRIASGGNVGIGSSDATELGQHRLFVAKDTSWLNDVTDAQLAVGGATTPGKQLVLGYDTDAGSTNGFGFIAAGNATVAWTDLALQATGGNVGIGTTSPTSKLEVAGQILARVGNGSNGLSIHDTNYNRLWTWYPQHDGSEKLTLWSDSGQGNILDIDVAGNMILDGALTQNGDPDIAENIIVTDQTIEAGDLVAIDPNYIPTEDSSIYDKTAAKKADSNSKKTILGVISTDAGIILNAKEAIDTNKRSSDNERPLTLAGRVPVKVSTINGNIEHGDYLTASSTPGVAMKATNPGPVVGKALESYSGSEVKKILTFVQLGFADPQNILANLTLDTDGSLIIPKIKTDSLSLKDLSVGIGEESTHSTGSGQLAGSGTLNSGDLTQVGTDASEGTQSAALASYLDLGTTLKTLQDKITGLVAGESTTSAQLTDLSSSLASQSAVLANTTNAIASNSARLEDAIAEGERSKDLIASLQHDIETKLTPPDVLLATSSAQLADLDVSNQISTLKLESIDATISGIFKSLGQTSLGDTTIAGTLAVDGTLSFTGDSINSISNSRTDPTKIGVLYLQDSALASLVDLFNSKVTIDNTGKLAIESLAVGSSTLGSATIPAGATEVIISGVTFTDTSKVFLTPTSSLTGTLIVPTNQPTGTTFKVQLTSPNATPVKFNWWIVESKVN